MLSKIELFFQQVHFYYLLLRLRMSSLNTKNKKKTKQINHQARVLLLASAVKPTMSHTTFLYVALKKGNTSHNWQKCCLSVFQV